jgi:hypothetical protein
LQRGAALKARAGVAVLAQSAMFRGTDEQGDGEEQQAAFQVFHIAEYHSIICIVSEFTNHVNIVTDFTT